MQIGSKKQVKIIMRLTCIVYNIMLISMQNNTSEYLTNCGKCIFGYVELTENIQKLQKNIFKMN